MKQNKIEQTAGRDLLGDFAPQFAHYNDDILFGENWNDGGIDLKTRCIITVVALMSSGITDSSLTFHLKNARDHGVTRAEIASVITHTAFYTGWPKGWTVFSLARDIWKDETPALTGREAFQQELLFPIGEANTAFGKYFTGQSYLNFLSKDQEIIYNITFEPGCRTNWHRHVAASGGGHVLIGLGGRGYYQIEGADPVEILPGDIVHIYAGQKHWHGAAPDSWFSHLAIETAGNESADWLEAVSEEAYRKLK